MNDSKKQLNPEATTEILSLINSDDPGCERGYNPALYRMRHTVARLKEARGMRHEYEPCAYCPKFLAPVEENTPATTPPEPQKPVEQHQAKPEEAPKEKQQVKTYPRSTEKCPCGSTLSKKGYCYACKKWPNKSQPEDIASTLAPKTGAEKSICNETAPKVTQENSNVTFEPAANTIHASPAPQTTEPETSWQAKSIAELPISLRELQRIAHENAVAKGWHETRRSDGEMICLMHSELSEALEELRNDKAPSEVYFKDQKPEGVPIELADVVIRIFDFCGLHNIDLQAAIVTKMVYNQTRPHRHGGKKL